MVRYTVSMVSILIPGKPLAYNYGPLGFLGKNSRYGLGYCIHFIFGYLGPWGLISPQQPRSNWWLQINMEVERRPLYDYQALYGVV